MKASDECYAPPPPPPPFSPFVLMQLKKANPAALGPLRDRPRLSSLSSSEMTHLYADATAFVSEDPWWSPTSSSCKPVTMATSELQSFNAPVGPSCLDDTNVLIKHSSDPYTDFRQSMLTMIEEEGLQVTYPKSHYSKKHRKYGPQFIDKLKINRLASESHHKNDGKSKRSHTQILTPNFITYI